MKWNYDLERAIAQDDHLDLREAHRNDVHETCRILFHYEEICEQCSRRTWQPHVTSGRTFCRRCCPACAKVHRLGQRAS